MTSKKETYRPRHLGQPSRRPVDRVDLVPWTGPSITVTLRCQELTSLCPVTAQPDFGQVTITYVPTRHIVETKSLKLYLWRFRNEGIFNEALIAKIADDLFKQVRPEWIEVEGQFASRGGISISAKVRRP